MLVKLYKLAYSLDRKGLYDEAKEIEEVMKAMADKVGLNAEGMAELADYFDSVGETALADKFDEMIKEAKKKILAQSIDRQKHGLKK